MNYILVTVTFPDRKLAEEIAEELIRKKYAACCQIFPGITSIYAWKGKIENTEETLCFIKTRMDLFHTIEKVVHAFHPYEVPEIAAIPLCALSPFYRRWLEDSIAEEEKNS